MQTTRRNFAVAMLGFGGWQTAAPGRAALLKNLRSGHPRLMLGAEGIEPIRRLIQNSPLAATCYKGIHAQAEATCGEKPSEYEIKDGLRLLPVSRMVKERVHVLALAYLIEKDRRYRDRMWAELSAAAQFKDWNPHHFLDTAEMTYAFSIAYDWLYADWTAEQRKTLRNAIVRLGLQPGMEVYRSESGWHTKDNNWNQVCNGGMGIGALAIADENPELARDILHEAIRSIPRSMSHYAPDGAGTEGPTYWDYGSRFNIKFISSLETALGTDFGLARIPGFGESGFYQMYMCGADMQSFDFEDSGSRRMGTPMHFWMGRRFGRPEYSWFRYRELASGAQTGNLLDLLWFDDKGRDYDPAGLPLERYFREAEAVTVRSSWTDPNALVVAMQAGNTNGFKGHRHLDLGTFILDANGERWIIDSGLDHETYLKHQNNIAREDFYRIRAEGHNTLAINPGKGPDQDPNAFARVTSFKSEGGQVKAVFDLTPAYAAQARKVERTLSVIRPNRVTITDRITAAKPSEVWWFAHTTADVTLSAGNRRAVMTRNGKRYTAELVSPAKAQFQLMDAAPLAGSPNPAPQASNEGRRKLAIRFSGVSEVEITVAFGPSFVKTPFEQ
jgi:hypothetical protein